MYLVEEDQGNVEDFNLLGYRNRWDTDNLCSTTGKVTSPAEMPDHLIGDLRSTMLAYKVEHIILIRLNRHLVDEVRELDAAVE